MRENRAVVVVVDCVKIDDDDDGWWYGACVEECEREAKMESVENNHQSGGLRKVCTIITF